MRHKLLFPTLLGLCFLMVATTLYLGSDRLTRLSSFRPPSEQEEAFEAELPASTSSPLLIFTSESNLPSISASATATAPTTPSIETDTVDDQSSTSSTILTPSDITSSGIVISNGTILDAKAIAPFVTAILDPVATNLPRLQCPPLNADRYDALRTEPEARLDNRDQPHIDYFFALNLRNCVGLLPRLLGSVVEAIRFLGPSRCALSIVEGNSPDGTGDVLNALGPFLEELGIVYLYNNSAIDPSKGDRIQKLIRLRNLALYPLFNKDVYVSEDTTVLFINDVAACTEDILELALQRYDLNADMTCAMDWTFPGDSQDPTFYDVWIARDIQGDTFFRIGQNGNWDLAWELFPDNPQSKARLDAHLPFQVFACWNGAVVFTAAPLINGLRFRQVNAKADECWQGEPELFCKDMWFRGYGKIAVVPSVNLEYTDERAARLKTAKGYVTDLIEDQQGNNRIEWQGPPDQVLCMPEFHRQSWRPWNETLH